MPNIPTEQPVDHITAAPEPVLTLRLYQRSYPHRGACVWRGTLHDRTGRKLADARALRWHMVLAMLEAALEEVLPSDGDEDGV